MNTFCCVVILATLSVLAEGFSTGAPNGGVCLTLVPKHKETPVQNGESPYSIWIDKGSIKSTREGTLSTPDSVIVTLKGRNGAKPFKGFILQARSAADDSIVGTWTSVTSGKIIDCDSKPQNAITHTSPDAKTEITAKWTPSSDFKGRVIFKGTVVEQFTTIWANFKSLPVNVV